MQKEEKKPRCDKSRMCPTTHTAPLPNQSCHVEWGSRCSQPCSQHHCDQLGLRSL